MLDYTHFNLWAVLVAAVSCFVLGGLWYGPILGKAWMRACNLTENELQQGHPAIIYGGALVLQIVAAWALSMLIGDAGWAYGLHWGLFAGLAFAVTASSTDYLFEQRNPALHWINGGYKVVNFAVMGTIIGAWQ